MKRMGIEALYRKPNTSKPAPGHKIYPYLLRGMTIDRAQPGVGHGHHLRARWRAASSISPRSWTGSAGGFSPGGCRSPWRRHSASRRWRRRWPGTAGPRSSTPIRAAQFTSRDFTERAAQGRDRHQHGRQGLLAGQRLRRAALAIDQVRGGLSQSLRHGQRGPRLDRPVPGLLQSLITTHISLCSLMRMRFCCAGSDTAGCFGGALGAL